MLTTRFKLPPLEGDDVAMLMERDMLRRWGFLGQCPNKATKNNQPGADNCTSGNANTSRSSDSSCTSSDEEEEVNSDDEEIDDGDRVRGIDNEKQKKDGDCVREDKDKNGDCEDKEEANISVKKGDNDEGVGENEDENQKGNDKVGEIGIREGKETDCRENMEMVNKVDVCEENQQGDEKVAEVDKDKYEERDEIGQDNKEKNQESSAKNQESSAENQESSAKNQESSADNQIYSSSEISSTSKIEDNLEFSSQANEQNGTENRPMSVEEVKEIKTENSANIALQEQNGGRKRKMTGEILVLFEAASRHYEKDDLCECLLSVEEALELCNVGDDDGDDGGDLDVTPLWLLRAKVMNSMENYKEALRSAYKVMAKERPSRLWIEGAIAMEKMGIQVTAELWIAMGMHKWKEEEGETVGVTSRVTSDGRELWDAAVDSDVMCVLKLMQNRLRIARIYGPLVVDKPIKVIPSLKYNKTVKATQKIKKGEILFQEIPDILEQSVNTHRITSCAECAKSLFQPEDVISKASTNAAPKLIADIKKGLRKIWPKLKVVSCSFCREVKYCSEDCRSKGWEKHHKVICPSNAESTAAMLYDVRRSFRDVIAADGSSWQGWWNTEYSPTLLSRMTAMVLCKANLLADLKTRENYSDAHWSMCEAILDKYSPCDKMKAADQVPKMQELLNNIFKRSKFLRYDLTKEIFNKRYSQAMTNVIRFHDTTHPMNNFAERIKTENEKLYKKIKKNDDNALKNPTIPEFHGLFPLASCVNHSCYPNAVVESMSLGARPGIALKAIRDIREGDEVFVAYVEPRMERHDRRKILWKKYKFVCECPRCLHQGIGPHVCTNCGKTANDIKERKAGTPPRTESADETFDSQEDGVQITSSDILEENCKNSENVNTSESSPNCEASENRENKDIVPDSTNQIDSISMTMKSLDCGQEDGTSDLTDQNNDHQLPAQNTSTDDRVDNGDNDKVDNDDIINENENKEDGGKSEETSSKDEPTVVVKSNNANDSVILESESKIGEEKTVDNGAEKMDDVTSKIESKTDSKTGDSVVKFSACGRCKKAWYCSVQCQKDSWTSGHKRICNAP